MEVLIADPGARGHALARKIAESSLVDRIFMAPGNPGTAEIAENTGITHTDIESQLDFVRKQKKIGMVVISADDPLADGAVDAFESEFAGRDLRVWGPRKNAAEIEWSKVYAKRLMQNRGIPTARFAVLYSLEQAGSIESRNYPLYAKMDKLFGGKGVERCHDIKEVEAALSKFHRHGRLSLEHPVLVEEESKGIELSLQAFCDGTDYVMVPFAMKDHKTIHDDDTGPMTGGMGVIGPVPGLSREDIDTLGEIFVAPVLAELARQGRPFKGMLYPGLRGWQCLEYNARPGDPEAQVWAAMLESDLVEVMVASCGGELSRLPPLIWRNAATACLVLAAKGYPDNPQKGVVITGHDVSLPGNSHLLHAGTARHGNDLVVNGGRVLNVVTVGEEGESLRSVIDTAYKASDMISFDGKQTRHDVGEQVLSEEFGEYIDAWKQERLP